MTEMSERYARVPGWGADLDPANRPAVPKEKPSNVRNVRGDVPIPRQQTDVKIFRSVEHPDLTPVFGTTCPPRGLSGVIREYAYQFSEGRLQHWLALMLADRVDVVEGVLEDATGGDPKARREVMLVGAAVGAVALALVLPRVVRRLKKDG